jgi:hypothetical protein
MKQWLKNFALAGATAAAAVLGAASASAVSFTVVIDKIELLENGNSADRFVVYNPATGVGGTATTTLDLLNANKSGASLPIAAPKGGTYRTMLVTFSSIRVAAETADVSATQDVGALLGTAHGFGEELGRKVLVMGDPGTGATSISALLNGGAAFATVPPMQPAVSNGVTVTLPAINFFLPTSNVVISGNSVGVTTLPVAIPVARNDVDSAQVPNVTVGVKGRAFAGSTALPENGGNFAVRVGLFRSALDLKPLYVQTATIVSNSLTTDASITEVTFLDVADGTYIPLAWIDANNNGLLDSGESTIMSDAASTALTTDAARLTINKEDLFGTGAAGVVSSTSAAFDVSAAGSALGTVFGGETANGYLGESGDFYAFPARAISITLTTTSAASVTLGNDAIECTDCSLRAVWNGVATAPADAAAAVTLTIGNVTAPGILFRMDDDDTSTGADNNLNAADLLRLVAITNADNCIDSINGFNLIKFASVDPADDTELYARLTISPVPLATLTNIDQATAYGTYSISGSVRAQNTDTQVNIGAADAFTISSGDVALGSGDHTVATATVNVPAKVLTADLGD